MKLPYLRLAFTLGIAALAFTALTSAQPAHADVKLPLLLSDGCVLQQKTPVRIYGTALPGEKVSIAFEKQSQDTVAGSDGNWQVMLKPLKAGGPFTLTVRGRNTVIVRDILVGEVWICSGQSNMEFTVGGGFGGAVGSATDIAASSDPQLRLFTVPRSIAREPKREITGGAWQPARPDTAREFSAVGYYFARALRQARKVPVGMIHTSWGGTRIEAWTRREVLLANGTPESEFAPAENSPAMAAAMAAYRARFAAWKASGSPAGQFIDPGRDAVMTANWESLSWDDAGWGRITVPGAWERSGIGELASLDGAVWFRRFVEVPEGMAGSEATLSLGAIDDNDTTFVNGRWVGATGPETPNAWSAPRRYTIPAGLLKPGRNVVAVRVWDSGGDGGLTGPSGELYLEDRFPAGVVSPIMPERIDLSGEWKYKIEIGRAGDPGPSPDADNPNMASGLYNAMLAPLVPYTIKGALWYQGESNAGGAVAYRKQLPAMIQNWRDDFGIKDFPFLVVQLAPFMAINPNPEDPDWARLREAQLMATRALPNVGMAVTTDVGNQTDIHPKDKRPVGERLALLARTIAYGEKIVANGPIYRSMKVENGKAVLTLDSVGGGLTAHTTDSAGSPVPDGQLRGFDIAGADGKFVRAAEARITGKDTIEVWSPLVPEPKAVRFGWSNYPVVNLWNDAGLPASPFRTDAP